MDTVLIVVIALLCAYPVSIFGLYVMLKQRYAKTRTIVWNTVIIALPAVGALAFFVYLAFSKRKVKPAEEGNGGQNTEVDIGTDGKD